MRIHSLVQTCGACPSQWSALSEHGDILYIRYRHGCLSLDVNDVLAQEHDVPRDADGFMTEGEMLYRLDLVVKPDDVE
jgi:hypothetical protein